jgi:hypothetical protein
VTVFSPEDLFAASEVGVWYDPSPETCFTTSTGTTAAGVGDPVGLMLDKSKQQSWIDVTGVVWTKTAGDGVVTVSGNTITITGATTATQVTRSAGSIPLVAGRAKMVIQADWVTATGVNVWLRGGPAAPVNGVQTLRTAPLNNSGLERLDVATGSVTFTISSFQYWAGNHAVQSTAAARPILARVPASGRRNLLTRTEEFNNAAWAKAAQGDGVAPVVTANAGLAPDGTTTAERVQFSRGTVGGGNRAQVRQTVTMGNDNTTLSVWMRSFDGTSQNVSIVNSQANLGNENFVVTGEWQRFDIQSTSVLATGNQQFWVGLHDALTPSLTADVLIWGAQLELGSTATDYQRVGSTYDVTEAGQADNYHLVFDGVDDSMVTPTVDFTGTDEMSVFAGVRKLSDAANQTVVELSESIPLNNGAFAFSAVGSSGTSRFNSKGTNIASAPGPTDLAPVTLVLTGLGNISDDSAILRADGIQVASSVADQGTGNYGNYPLYIGSRGGVGDRFNGHLYQLLVRGALTADNLLNQTETYVASKTAGVTLP